ncbi:hypothetical protein COO59_16480 [Mixta theicola]|uniref:Uncharacterized protein n=1 Tax=Mixta theicola TaxID=1458355 RepID=A0A2K1Q6L9_9GAMM|nr:hypothetical protein [Mixta theicola]PNS10700.1 hypothetical protein COO59_16480 [Mixta theicola]GLR10902.1 hypothetical protein GCM10007905_36220 [Mixta theicola]
MRLKTVISHLHIIVTLVLLVTVVGGIWLKLTDTDRADDKLIGVRQLDKQTWLYITEYDGGGATVPYIYRYYLAGKLEGNVSQQLADIAPFMRAATANAKINADDVIINVKYQGRVYAFNNLVPYRYQEKTIFPRIHFETDYEPQSAQK